MNLMTNTVQPSKIPPGVYSVEEYLEEMRVRNIPIESVAEPTRKWLEECKECDDEE
jgi:hypothetical protein